MTTDDISEKQKMRYYRINQVYFYLTGDCNLRCRHCWIAPSFQASTVSSSFLPLDLFKSVVEQAKPLGLMGVKLTGGEPLLHPQILEILEFIREQNLHLNIETNAVLCTPDKARAIAACKAPHVSVSIDGADAETHEWVRGVDGCFEDALAGIRNLVAAGVHPQIIMSIMRRNSGQIEAVVKLAKSLGVSTVKFNIVTPTLRGEQLQNTGENLSIEEFVKIGEWIEKSLSKSSDIPLFYSHPMAYRPLGNMFGDNCGGCGTCDILGIIGVLANGTYALCGIGENVPELTCGNVAKDPLRQVWENAPFFREIREGMPARFEGVCGECVMKQVCLGGCVAQNYYRRKSLWAPFWYCEEAKNKGLFPSNRLLETFIS